MRTSFIFLAFLFLGLIGCTNMDRVAPMSWTYYLSDGASESEIRLALLDCGSNVPGDEREFFNPGGNGFQFPPMRSDYMLVVKCMQNAGFSNNEFKNACNHPTAKNRPACKPDAAIPTRSVENRLNSPYCKTYPTTRLCQPVVVSEAEWNEIHKEEIEARRLKLDEANHQGYSTTVGTAEARYCREQAKKNTLQEGAKPYFEKCLKENFKAWNPFLSFE
jgi:hypothetical protein